MSSLEQLWASFRAPPCHWRIENTRSKSRALVLLAEMPWLGSKNALLIEQPSVALNGHRKNLASRTCSSAAAAKPRDVAAAELRRYGVSDAMSPPDWRRTTDASIVTEVKWKRETRKKKREGVVLRSVTREVKK